jgi:hypothetical protein
MPMVQMPQSQIADRAVAAVVIQSFLAGKAAMVHLDLFAYVTQTHLI